jgi:hypothetical protein
MSTIVSPKSLEDVGANGTIVTNAAIVTIVAKCATFVVEAIKNGNFAVFCDTTQDTETNNVFMTAIF